MDQVISRFIPNEKIDHLYICNHSIITFGGGGFFMGFLDTNHVDSLDRFRKFLIEEVINVIETLNIRNSCQEDKN